MDCRSSTRQNSRACPVDPLTAAILNQSGVPDGAAQVTQQLMQARKRDPKAQLFPEVSQDIIASGFLFQAETDEKAGHRREATWMKTAIETFKLNLLAYPDSADAHFNLADAYLKDGLKDLAREYAEKALAQLDWHTALKVLQNPHLRKRVGRGVDC